MTESILNSVKKTLNLAEDFTSFDADVILHINSVLSTLNQLGIGPEEGYMIEGSDETWVTFFGSDPRLNNVKSYIYLRVRMLFDPPTTGYHTQAMQEQIKEMEWRINVYREGTEWVDPDPDRIRETVLDGGGAE